MRGLMRGAVLAGAVAVMLSSGMGIADASPPRLASGAPTWSIMPAPRPPADVAPADVGLGPVSCSSVSACTAVGFYDNSAGDRLTLAERWNGTAWTVQHTPNPSGATFSDLNGVSCPSASACMAVGEYSSGSDSDFPMLAERWNGKAWVILPTPSINATGFAVSCTSASACTAVGEKVTKAGVGVTLAERWNGKAWTVQHTPNPGGVNGSDLDGVSCTSAWACTAVGSFGTTAGGLTLAEDWNGTKWVTDATPNPSLATNVGLGGVSCTSASACTAAGSYFLMPEGPGGTLAEHWNGTTWTNQRIPNPPGNNGDGNADGGLGGVSCTSASACTAVGSYDNNNIIAVTLAEHWNGTKWAIQHTPNPSGATWAGLGGVWCTSASACIAIGGSNSGPLAERYGPSS
jgi:hypothetical protein